MALIGIGYAKVVSIIKIITIKRTQPKNISDDIFLNFLLGLRFSLLVDLNQESEPKVSGTIRDLFKTNIESLKEMNVEVEIARSRCIGRRIIGFK